MPRPSLSQVLADAAVSFPDNISGAITPLILRTWIGKLVEAIRPAYGYVQRVTGTQTVNNTDAPVVMDTATLSTVVDYTLTPATSIIQRLEHGMTEMEFSADVTGTNGTIVTFTLYKDGSVTPWRVSGTLAGAGKPVSIAMSMLQYSGSPASYQMKVKIDTGSQALTLAEMVFLAKSIPVWEY